MRAPAHAAPLLALVLTLAGACDAPRPRSSRAQPDAGPTPVVDAKRTASVAAARAKIRARIRRHAALPKKIGEKRCEDSELVRRAKDSAARVLQLTTEDARYQAKSLLPLSITDQLTVPRWTALEDALAGVGDPSANDVDVGGALAAVRLHDQRRFLGTYHVVYFRVPKRIHKLGKRKAEWVAGVLDTWFVIHDASSLEPLCQTRLTVRNDVKDAPLAVRLKSDTRNALVRTLGRELRDATPAAVSRISGVLTAPDRADPRVARR